MFKSLDRYQPWAPVVLRIVVGVIFLLHGLAKFGVMGGGGIAGTTGFFTQLGMPLPAISAPLVATLETLGGLALILGLGTRIVAALLSVVMLVAIVAVKLPKTINPAGQGGYELELALLAGLVALLLLGSGTLALDRRFPALR